jgi:tRNA pseudouridine13 synthase
MPYRYRDSNPEEKNLGLELFFTDTPGIEGRIKTVPEDFVVTERSLDIPHMTPNDIEKRPKHTEIFTYATVKTYNWETNRMIQKLSEALHVGFDKIFFAGSKDKRAVTTQLMAFSAAKEAVENINLDGIEISNTFLSSRILKIGDLLGNDFEISIREISLPKQEVEGIINDTYEQLIPLNGFPNFFGVQRFGIMRPVTHKIGKLIAQKEYEKAVLMYIGHPITGEPGADHFVRGEFDKTCDLEWAIDNYPTHLTFERILIKYLIQHPENYLGALSQLPKNLSTMFIHAYQSYLFNRILCDRVRAGITLVEPVLGDIVLPVDDNKLPLHKTWIPVTKQNLKKLTKQCRKGNAYTSGVLFGCETGLTDGEFGEIEHRIIETEGLKAEDFIIPEFSTLSSKGSRRELVAPVSDFSHTIDNEKLTVKFGLMKGAYATTFLREFLKSGIRNY